MPPDCLHVVPHARGSWHVHREGDDQPLSEHSSATEAEHAAVALAADEDPIEIVLHDRYGRLRIR